MMEIAKESYENRCVCTVDIISAYLNANMGSVKVHMRLDKRITDIHTLVVLLDKALYGCVEAARLWYECLIGAL
jgi:hypothetical protein